MTKIPKIKNTNFISNEKNIKNNSVQSNKSKETPQVDFKAENTKKKPKIGLFLLKVLGILFLSGLAAQREIRIMKVKKELTKVFDDMWEMSVKNSNDIFQKIQYEKPKIAFNRFRKIEEEAAYNIKTNTIEISTRNLREFAVKDKDSFFFGSKNSLIKMFKESKFRPLKYKRWKPQMRIKNKEIPDKLFTRLNPSEMAIVNSGTIAHEIRHGAQLHILANTKDINLADLILNAVEQNGGNVEKAKKILASSYLGKKEFRDLYSLNDLYELKGTGVTLKTQIKDLLDGFKKVISPDYMKTYQENINELDSQLAAISQLNKLNKNNPDARIGEIIDRINTITKMDVKDKLNHINKH